MPIPGLKPGLPRQNAIAQPLVPPPLPHWLTKDIVFGSAKIRGLSFLEDFQNFISVLHLKFQTTKKIRFENTVKFFLKEMQISFVVMLPLLLLILLLVLQLLMLQLLVLLLTLVLLLLLLLILPLILSLVLLL